MSACTYFNATQVNGNTICESISNLTYCPFFQNISGNVTCLLTCSGFTQGQQCYSSCPSTHPLVASAGSKVCVSSCASNIYFVNGSVNQCNATCQLPYGTNTTNMLYTSGAALCGFCPSYVNRSSEQCVASCTYINASTVNSSVISICEIVNDTNCPY